MRIFLLLLENAIAHFNEPIAFAIGGNSAPFGAVTLIEDFSTRELNLATDCGINPCPSVLIFSGQQWGTINIVNCQVGQMYMFVNRSRVDLGIVVQQAGGAVGSKGISRFGMVTCFCVEEQDENGLTITDVLFGILLCG